MCCRGSSRLAGASFVAVVAFAVIGAAQPLAEDPLQPRADNYYAAGNRVAITTPMAADVVVAGRDVDIASPVAGDVLAAGWRVTVSAQADDDVRIAAREVVIDAPVRGDLTIAGGDVRIGPAARVSGRSWLTGQSVRIEGMLDREVRIAAAAVTVGGEIRRPLEVVAERFEILPTARVLAPVAYKGSTDMRVAQGAIVNGPVTYDRIPEREARRARAFPAATTLLFSVHLFLAGLLVVVFLPRVETSVVGTLRAQPGRSFLGGLALLVAPPLAAVLLIVSVLGLPFGLAVGALYAIALFCGLVATAFFVGDAEARFLTSAPVISRRQNVAWLLAGVLTIALLRSALGGVVVFFGVLFGLGALALAAYRAASSGPAMLPA